jgi:hypothetical protein
MEKILLKILCPLQYKSLKRIAYKLRYVLTQIIAHNKAIIELKIVKSLIIRLKKIKRVLLSNQIIITYNVVKKTI